MGTAYQIGALISKEEAGRRRSIICFYVFDSFLEVRGGLFHIGGAMPLPFSRRHIGPSASESDAMLRALGCASLDALIDEVVPAGIRLSKPMTLPEALSEEQALVRLRDILSQNQVLRSFIGMGYHDTFTPSVILRNVLENPGWYTAYTPYQAEIAQGRLEALLNFQTMICSLTALDVANASLLDEGTAVAEALALSIAWRCEAGVRQRYVSSPNHRSGAHEDGSAGYRSDGC
jgi:glycine cleavage system pyridoxal-binding protein P